MIVKAHLLHFIPGAFARIDAQAIWRKVHYSEYARGRSLTSTTYYYGNANAITALIFHATL